MFSYSTGKQFQENVLPSWPDIPRTVITVFRDPEDGSIKLFLDCFGPENGGGGCCVQPKVTIYPTTWSNISKSVFTICR